ncbi:MAG: ribonuclease Z [Bacteroidaceae bacterium]|nr:ribonuclease Z [Bacteroidaceae bacterium]
MEKFELTILGCGSAKPTTRHLPSSQVLNVRDKLFMIDCGEGTQLQYCRNKLPFSRLNHIFISHLHGDHMFGLPGLISTFNLLGRTAELHIHSPKGLEQMMKPLMDFASYDMSYQVFYHEFDTNEPTMIFEDRTLTVTTIPLKHRVPTCGFLFKEKGGLKHIRRDMIDAYEIPIAYINSIKAGADYVLPDGEVILNERLTNPASKTHSYAYCSDTIYLPEITDQLQGVDLLYHEATYAAEHAIKAQLHYHSTTLQAAQIAKDAQVKQLVIGHFSSRYIDDNMLLEEAKSVFPNTILAKENALIVIDD